jgi:hypothetical protein
MVKSNYLSHTLSTEILSKSNGIQGDEIIPYLHLITEHFHNFGIHNLDKFF